MTSLPFSPAPKRSPAARFHEKLSPKEIEQMRAWVEDTAHPLRTIARALCVSISTVHRYAREGGWTRPEGVAAMPEIPVTDPESPRPQKPSSPLPDNRREQIVDKLWTLAERHAEILETQPIERAERSLQPLARLTRTLGEMDKHVRPPLPAHQYDIDAPKPRRSLHELRDELAAHLERINREEGYGWEVREWWFWDGGGI